MPPRLPADFSLPLRPTPCKKQQTGPSETLSPGDVIVAEGEKMSRFYIVNEGD